VTAAQSHFAGLVTCCGFGESRKSAQTKASVGRARRIGKRLQRDLMTKKKEDSADDGIWRYGCWPMLDEGAMGNGDAMCLGNPWGNLVENKK
jgi:hypothetical protein